MALYISDGNGNLTKYSGNGADTDVQVDNASITADGIANLKTINGNYNATSNKLATASDIPTDTGATSIETTGSGNVVSSASYDSTTKKITLTKGVTALTSHQDISGKEDASNKVTSISSASTDTQYPSAKLLYDQLAGKQDTIDSSHKLSADYVSDGTTNKAYTATEQTKLSGIESGAEVNDVTDIQVNGTSILSSKVANIVTNTAYDSSSNKIATMSDLPADEVFVATYNSTTYAQITAALSAYKELIMVKDGTVARYMGSNESGYLFRRVTGNQIVSYTCSSSSTWSSSTFDCENKSNKVTSISSSSTDTQYPSAKCVYDSIQDVVEVASGKTASYVVDDTVSANTAFNSQNTTITLTAAFTDVNKGSITLNKLNVGDVFYVTQTDVPDRWVQTIVESSGSYTVTLNKMETAKVPVTDVQIDGTSIVSSNVASVVTINGDYNASTNKLATESDLPDLSTKMDKANPTGTGSLSINRKANTTIGTNSVAVGNDATASGYYSFAEGVSTTASGTNGSHAEGSHTTASGESSHSEGQGTTASGKWAHAEGVSTTASGNYSHAEGVDTVAQGAGSHAEGRGTFVGGQSQHVFGEYNIRDLSSPSVNGNYVEIVGNGTADNARSNARTLDWSGNEKLAGWVTMNGSVDAAGYTVSSTAGSVSLPYYTKNEIDSMIGDIDSILTILNSGGGV